MKWTITSNLIIFCYFFVNQYSEVNSNKTVVILPWMGVLIYKPDNHSIEEVTNIVMIEHSIAIGNAKDIGSVNLKSLKKFSKAMFYDKGIPWFCKLAGIMLHPEFEQGFINTVAILFLDSTDYTYIWKAIPLLKDYKEHAKWTKTYNVGYKDSRMMLEQDIYPVGFVTQTECEEFYFNEELNFAFLWPTNTMCYKAIGSTEKCVMTAGMALATNYSGEWLLMGLSTNGPGCSLPARYIEIVPYVKWLMSNTVVAKTRRANYLEAIWSESGHQEFLGDTFKNVYEKNMPLYPYLANITEVLIGCYSDYDTRSLMYKDISDFRTKSPHAIGLYRLIFADWNYYHRIACGKLITMCTARSKSWIQGVWGVLLQEDHFNVKFAPVQPLAVDKDNSYAVITDPEYIRKRTVYELWFKFSFNKVAHTNVRFYGFFEG